MAKSHILRLAGIALVASGLYVYLAKYNLGDSPPAGLPAEQAIRGEGQFRNSGIKQALIVPPTPK